MDAPNSEEDPTASRKESVTARLLQREEDRKARQQRQKDEQSSSSQQQDRTDRLSLAGAIAAEAERIREALRLAGDAAAFQPLSADVQALQRILNDGVALLSSYDVRKAQELIDALRNEFQAQYARAQPKKKFAFTATKRRPHQQHPLDMTSASNASAVASDVSEDGANAPSAAAENSDVSAAAAGDRSNCLVNPTGLNAGLNVGLNAATSESADFVVSGLRDVEIERSGDEVRRKCIAVSALSGCLVRLRGAPGAVRLTALRGCTVLVGPVASSVFVDDCVDCTFVVACHQLRVHGTVSSRFYVHVTSKPIVEDCSSLGFAPYAWQYDGANADFEASGLSRSVNRWDQVDDFNWLANDQPSPNWTVIHAESRIAF